MEDVSEVQRRIVQQCARPPHKLPEPLHLAHRLADKESRNLLKEK